jgi:hypothetical protein
MSYFVYFQHCYEIVGLEEFETAEKAGEKIVAIRKCCKDADIRVVQGQELKIKNVEVVTKVEFE